MVRPLRIEYPGAVYHVTSRGDRRGAVNGDGSFVSTPEANFFGSDSFTNYLLGNEAGTELSNTATVSLTVAAVNDGPVAGDVLVATLEGSAATINLIAADVDSASASLQFIVQTQPTAHT